MIAVDEREDTFLAQSEIFVQIQVSTSSFKIMRTRPMSSHLCLLPFVTTDTLHRDFWEDLVRIAELAGFPEAPCRK